MTGIAEREPTEIEFLESLYGEPLRQTTSRTGKTLVVSSLTTIAIVKFNARFEKSTTFPISFESRADVLLWPAFGVVFLLIVNFLLKALTDLARERESKLVVTRYIERIRVEAAVSSARAIDNQEPNPHDDGPEPDQWWEKVAEVKQAAEDTVRKAEKKLGLRALPLFLRKMRILAEVCTPPTLGMISLYLVLQKLLGP